ncbi:hypothetical protein K469DRAFT_512952, partial [Zopfia rhizophila CBS 207.26]
MEALLAVGLAGNVVQFVQFTGKLITESNEIRRKGSPSSLPDLKSLSETLTKHAGLIKAQLKASNAILTQEDQYLLDTATDCEEAGSRFLAYLDSLLPKLTSSNLLRSAQLSIKLHWSHHKIEDFVSRLEKLRSALTLATVLAFRASVNTSNENILARLKEFQSSGQTQDIGKGEILKALQCLVDIVKEKNDEALNTVQKKIDKLWEKIPIPREREILEWLDFRQMSWRFEEIDPAYQRTYEWIFRSPPGNQDWDDFTAHLRGSNVTMPYFINGKPGSGKSTLMKFIVKEPETKKSLKLWAGKDELLVLKFFFWNLGTRLQKSITGMLRALLHNVLDRYPELIPAVLPSFYRNWQTFDVYSEPTYVELKKAFELLKEKSASFLKLCVFIDGIDELDGDHRDISAFLRSLASSNIKLVLSSRPINACLNAFRGCPTLRLQDLTRPDMDIFVRGQLSSYPLMIALTNRFPSSALDLITEVNRRAEGVFLWVKLVVRLLVNGLEEGDSMRDLQDKLYSLPSDLRSLYQRMIGRMQPEYQLQAAQMFQIFRTWSSLMVDQPLRALVFAYAIQSLSEAYDIPVAPLEPEAFTWLLGNTQARIQSRCCGLFELHKRSDLEVNAQGWKTGCGGDRLVVSYMHRTVAEFLTAEDVWNEICSMTKGSDFSPVLHLASACLSMVKVGG